MTVLLGIGIDPYSRPLNGNVDRCKGFDVTNYEPLLPLPSLGRGNNRTDSYSQNLFTLLWLAHKYHNFLIVQWTGMDVHYLSQYVMKVMEWCHTCHKTRNNVSHKIHHVTLQDSMYHMIWHHNATLNGEVYHVCHVRVTSHDTCMIQIFTLNITICMQQVPL